MGPIFILVATPKTDRFVSAAIVELMQRNSKLDCFVMFGEQTAQHLRDRFQLGLTQAAVDAYLDRLIVSSIGSNWTRLYDSVSRPCSVARAQADIFAG